ncbi:MAG: DsbA family protein, partial [Hyphomicrobiales bacterium]|nr:DsbA family protein [Hyphomicrobiales bacterium]
MIRLRGLLARLGTIVVAASLLMPWRMALAEDAPALSPEQKALVEQTVKEYIIAHPEIVQDALLELDKRQKDAENAAVKTALKTEAKAIYDVSAGTVVGNPKGDVTLVEFFDY